jgi:hypothetical protein
LQLVEKIDVATSVLGVEGEEELEDELGELQELGLGSLAVTVAVLPDFEVFGAEEVFLPEQAVADRTDAGLGRVIHVRSPLARGVEGLAATARPGRLGS